MNKEQRDVTELHRALVPLGKTLHELLWVDPELFTHERDAGIAGPALIP